MRWVLAALGGAFLLSLPLAAQLSRFSVMDFKFPEFYEAPPGSRAQAQKLLPKGLLAGAKGQPVSNDIYLITTMRLEHYQPDGRTNLIARAPECLLNTDTRVAWSTGRLEIVGMEGALLVEGHHGFRAFMTNSSLTISNRVRTILHQDAPTPSRP